MINHSLFMENDLMYVTWMGRWSVMFSQNVWVLRQKLKHTHSCMPTTP